MKTKIFQLFIWFSLPVLVYCQPAKIDSLEAILNTAIHDTVRMSVLEALYEQYKLTDLDKSLDIANQLLVVAGKTGVQKYECLAYRALGFLYGTMKLPMDSVEATFEKANLCFEEIGDTKSQGKVLNNLGGYYQQEGLHLKALSHFQQALAIAEMQNDTLAMIPSKANMANTFKDRQEEDKSLQYSHEALVLAKAIKHRIYISKITNNIANIYFNWERYDTALVLYEEALEIKREMGSELSMAITLANMGGIYVDQGYYEKGQTYLDEAYEISLKKNYPYGQGLSLRYMSYGALFAEQYDRAIDLSHKGLVLFGPDEVHKYTRDFHEVISDSYEALKMPDSALIHLKKSQEINDFMFQAEKEQQIQQIEVSYQVKQKEIENQLLKTEQSYIQQKLKNTTYVSIGLVIALFLASGWGFAVYRNNQAKKRMNDLLEAQVAKRTIDLQLANKQLKQVNYELQSFNYIASHDIKEPIRNVGNYVSLIFRRLPDSMKNQMKDYFNIIMQSIDRLYTLIEDIANYSTLSKDAPEAKKEVDLNALISNIESGMQSFIQERKGQIIFETLPTIWTNSSLVYVALKNLIENGIKFNQSAVPTVEILYQTAPLQHKILVKDNGIGIDRDYHEQIFVMFKQLHSKASYQGSGIGLALARLAIEKLGGGVSIQSKPGQGSIFILTIPKPLNVLDEKEPGRLMSEKRI